MWYADASLARVSICIAWRAREVIAPLDPRQVVSEIAPVGPPSLNMQLPPESGGIRGASSGHSRLSAGQRVPIVRIVN